MYVWIHFCRQASGFAFRKKRQFSYSIYTARHGTNTCVQVRICVCDVCGIAWWFWGRYTRMRVVHAIEWLRAIFPCEIFNQWCACRQILCGLFSRSRDLFPLIPTRNIIIIVVVVDTNKSAFIIIYKPSPHWQRHLGKKGTTIVTLCTQKIVLLLLWYNDINILCL